VQFAATNQPPPRCPVCEDQRQYIGYDGQQWTTLETLQHDHHTVIAPEATTITGIGADPAFAIGQRALLVQTPTGNILWDCISLLDDPAVAAVKALGGIAAIAISHPHFYASMVEWSRAFDAPIYLHAADRQWVMRPDPAVMFWEGETRSLSEGVTLIRCGGHFAGGTVLHWTGGAEGRGVLLSSDILTVAADRRHVSFMYSYPNLIPLPASAIQGIVSVLRPFRYDRIYGGWWQRVVAEEGEAAVERSAARYMAAIQGE